MGLCFSFQQREDIERLSQLLASGSLSQLFFGSYEITQNEIPDGNHDADLIEDDKNLDENLSRINPSESNDTLLGHTNTISPIEQHTTQPPSPQVQPLAPDTKVDDHTLERRRRRDERRAARANQPNHGEGRIRPEFLKSPMEHLEERDKVDFHVLGPFHALKKCLVLDIDYTIFDHKSDFELAPEFRRPYLHEFLKACNVHYNIIIWSATAFYHIQTKMEKLQLLRHPDFQICLALSKDHMIPYSFSLKRKTFFQDIKPLSVLWNRFPHIFTPANTIHIDDVAENFALNPQNGLRIDPFQDALIFRQADRELFYLTQYLTMISPLNSFESLDHCRWKDYIINMLWDAQTVFTLPPFSSPGPPSQHLINQHEQSLLLKRMIKEKAKEREREERAKEEERNRREQERIANERRDKDMILKELEVLQRKIDREVKDDYAKGREGNADAILEHMKREEKENAMFLARIDSKLFREHFNSSLQTQQNDAQNQPTPDAPDPPLDLPVLSPSPSQTHQRLQPINRQRQVNQRQGQRPEQQGLTLRNPNALHSITHTERRDNNKARKKDKEWTVDEVTTPAVFCS